MTIPEHVEMTPDEVRRTAIAFGARGDDDSMHRDVECLIWIAREAGYQKDYERLLAVRRVLWLNASDRTR